MRNLSCIYGNLAIRIAHEVGERQEHALRGETGEQIRLGFGINRSNGVNNQRDSTVPREQSVHGGFHTILGGDTVNHEDRMRRFVLDQNRIGMRMREQIKLSFLERQVRR